MDRAHAEYQKELYLTGIKALHFIASIAIYSIFWMLFRYGRLHVEGDAGFRYNYFVVTGYALCLFFFNRTYNAYLLGYSRIRTLAFSEILAQLLSAGIMYGIVSLAWNHWLSPLWFVPMLVLDLLLDAVWAYLANGYYFKLNPVKETILIYRNMQDKRRFGTMKGKPSERLYHIKKEMMYDGAFHDLRDQLLGFDAIFVAGVNSRCRNGILKFCKEEGIPGFFLPHVGDVIMQESMHIQSFDSPVLYVQRSYPRPEYRIVKRTFDLTMALVGLIVLSPILLITGLAIRLYDGGPAIYKQVRLTRDGREFKIWNLWSMWGLFNINKLQRGFRPLSC